MTQIEKIEIRMGDQVVSLSLAQVKELKEALRQLFPEAPQTTYVPYPYPVYPSPYIYKPWTGPYWTTRLDSNTCYLSLQSKGT